MPDTVKVHAEPSADAMRLPAIALRGLVVFPDNVIHFEVGREKSIAAIDWAMNNNSPVFLVTQKEMDTEQPGMEDLYTYGVIAEIKQMLRVSDELVKVLVEGKTRARLLSLESDRPFLVAQVRPAPMRGVRSADAEELEALLRSIHESFSGYAKLSPRLPKDVVYNILTGDDPVRLAEYIPANLLFKYQDKQDALNEGTLIGRLKKILQLLEKETRVLTIEKEIQAQVSEQMDKNQRDYYLREQMRVIAGELDEGEDTRAEADGYRKKILELKLDEEIQEKLLKEADRMSRMQASSQEAAVIRTYLDVCLALPWHVYTKDDLNIKRAAALLDKEHYGLKKVKERILEILAVRALAPDVKSQIICLVGPPGVGKTSIARSIAACMGRKYARMSLGGVRDEAEIRGHRRTYIGALPGKIISAITTAKSSNPLILLDEVDKLAGDFRGDPAAALLEALDPEQNATFRDHYLDIPFDLSKVLFITTANNMDTIPGPLLDRMDVIELPSYTRVEKFNIAKRHLLPKQLENTGLGDKVKIPGPTLYAIIDSYTREAGVRGLERTINEVLRKCARRIVAGDAETITVSPAMLDELLGPARIKPGYYNKTNDVGIANGLAWTSVGGELLPIEVQAIPGGSGKLQLTGSLGDVMKESAQLAITYARVHAEEYGIDLEKLKTTDLHIHAPEGAVPKDGPSAGVTLTTALISCLSGRPVRADLAMTGEITLHGAVLPIGGLREKSMAAYRESMKTVLIPQANLPDLYEVDEEVKKHVEFVPVKNLQQVLRRALLPAPGSRSVRKPARNAKSEQPAAAEQPASATLPQ
ncbi:MAG TPA: endopeptidase La [Candidatus Anaerofilum excrementigallinarum]|nr:endopeptidase La [Candidatus Anaerofilum excrementigallinarum]